MNLVILAGNLGRDPEFTYTRTGKAVARLSLATNEFAGRTQDGQPVMNVAWHNIEVWEQQAENCKKYLSKGSPILVEGKIMYQKYTAKDGSDRYWTVIRAHRIQFFGSKQQPEQQGQQYGSSADRGFNQPDGAFEQYGEQTQTQPSESQTTQQQYQQQEYDNVPF